jgi:membrane protein
VDRRVASAGATVTRRPILLIAGTVLATLAVQRHLSRSLHTTRSIPDEVMQVWTSRHLPGHTSEKWKQVALGTYERINRDRILATAAGVVFYGLLAIFPAVTALVSSYGLFADPATIAANLQSLALMLPEGSFAIVQDEIGRVVAERDGTLGITFIFGLVLATWSANAGMKAVIDALNVACEVEEKRGWLRLNLVSLAFTVTALAAIKHVGLDHQAELLLQIGRWPLLALVLFIALLVLYRYGPSRRAPNWRWLVTGAMAAVVLWLIGSALLSWYLSNFANYTATYGSLGAAIGFMTWMWMSAIIVLVGAELNSEIEAVHQR